METLNQKLKVTLGGLPQKIHIKTDNTALPVLLFLHGGPGLTNRHSIMSDHTDLLDTFTLATWDQRGSGGSFRGAKRETLTIKQLTDDAAELVTWLCTRFKKDKLFIIGGSWGSELGTHLSYRYPAKIAAYVGFGQVVDGTISEEICYRFTLDAARAAGDKNAVKQLEALGPPNCGVYKGGYNGLMLQRKYMMKHGGYSPSKNKRGMWNSFVKPMLLSGEYSPADLFGIAMGHKYVLKSMWDEMGRDDLAREGLNFEMPYFIFDGRLDNNTPASLVDEYFKKIDAPRKELLWFEKSGHNPMNDEPELFKTMLRQKLLQIAKEEQAKGVIV